MSSILRSFLLVIFYLVQLNCERSDDKNPPNNGLRGWGSEDIEAEAEGDVFGDADGGIHVLANSSKGSNGSKVSFLLYGLTSGLGAESDAAFQATAGSSESTTFQEASAEGNILSHVSGWEFSDSKGDASAQIDKNKK